jgi:hypothetical protein
MNDKNDRIDRKDSIDRIDKRERDKRDIFYSCNRYMDSFIDNYKDNLVLPRSKKMINMTDDLSKELDIMLDYSRLDYSIHDNYLCGYKALSNLSRSDVINLALSDFIHKFIEQYSNDIKVYEYYRKYDTLEVESDKSSEIKVRIDLN